MDMLDELVSIIMPAYNAEKYLGESIKSVLRQTWTNWQLIIIDDGSTDNTENISRFYEKFDSRIIYYKNDSNVGVAEARNIGVSHAIGLWIAFLDSDDCWESTKLKKQLCVADERNSKFLFTGSAFMNHQGKKINYYMNVPEQISYHKLLKQNLISCSSVLVHRSLIVPFPKSSSSIHEDYVVWLQILRNNQISACGINEPLLVYRISSTSVSANKYKSSIMTFRVYKYLELGCLRSSYYWIGYFVRSIIKYFRLKYCQNSIN
jgi:teichuronic acid biosynthesis glycosyltransferase TuaG